MSDTKEDPSSSKARAAEADLPAESESPPPAGPAARADGAEPDAQPDTKPDAADGAPAAEPSKPGEEGAKDDRTRPRARARKRRSTRGDRPPRSEPAQGAATPEAPVSSAQLDGEAEVDEATLKRRRIRRRRRITAPASRIAAASAEKERDKDEAAAEPDDARPATRRRRRSRRATAPAAGDHPAGDRPAGDRPAGDRPAGDRPAGARPAGDRPAGDRPAGARPAGDRPAGARPAGDRPALRRTRPRPAEQPVLRTLSSAPERRVYRLDLPADHPRRKAAEVKAAVEQPAPAKQAESSKITLILHPAPKAALKRKKQAKALTPKEALQAKARKRQLTAAAKEETAKPQPAAELPDEWLAACEPDQISAAINEAGAHAGALIKAWQDRSKAEAIALVARLEHLPSTARKAARRALSVLKSRGVEIPEGPEPEAAEDKGRQPDVSATFMPADGSGTSFLSIAIREPGGRYRVADAVVHEIAGITHANTARLAGKQIRKWQRRVRDKFGAAPVDVPLDWARYQIDAARRRNAESGQVLPMGLDACMPLFEPVPAEEPPHPLADLEQDLTEDEVSQARADSARLHNEPEFRGWGTDQRALDELLQKLSQKADAESRRVTEEALNEEVTAATDRFFTPERRQRISRRMRDSAISARKRAGDALARKILAVAKAVREAGMITSPPSDVPFLLSFFHKSLALMAHQGAGQVPVPGRRPPKEPVAEDPAAQEPPAETPAAEPGAAEPGAAEPPAEAETGAAEPPAAEEPEGQK